MYLCHMCLITVFKGSLQICVFMYQLRRYKNIGRYIHIWIFIFLINGVGPKKIHGPNQNITHADGNETSSFYNVQ